MEHLPASTHFASLTTSDVRALAGAVLDPYDITSEDLAAASRNLQRLAGKIAGTIRNPTWIARQDFMVTRVGIEPTTL